MTANPLIIKKYENRRLYNTATSQYINQDQVAQMVRDGQDVRVIDAATGEDLTRLILAQIVVEDAKAPGSVFPLEVLRRMIVASGRATQEGAMQYMKAMFDLYQNAYRAVPPPLNPLDFMRWGQSQGPGWPAANGPLAPEMPQRNSPPSPDGDLERQNAAKVDELQRRIAELEAAMPAARKKAKRKTSAKQNRGNSRRKS